MYYQTRFWSTILVLVAMAGSFQSVEAQLEFSDLQAGYEQNLAAFEKSSFRMEWRNSVEYDSQWGDATSDLVSALRKARSGSKQQLSYDMIIQSFSPPPEFLKATSEKQVGLFGYSRCPEGRRIRASWGFPEDTDWKREDMESKFSNGPVNHYTYTLKDAGEFVVSGTTEENGQKTFSIYPLELAKAEMLFFKLTSPLGFEFVPGHRNFNGACDFLYPSSPSDSRLGARYKISVSDELAIVEIEEEPREIVTDDGSFKTGFRVYAEVDMAKGFLPRVVKASRIGALDGEKLTKAADSYWSREIRYKIGFLENVGFYPQEVVEESFVLLPSKDDLVATIEEKGLLGYVIRSVNVAKKETDKLACELRETTSVIRCEPWTPKDVVSFFSTEVPEGVDRINDRKNGDFRINKSIEQALAIELDRVPDSVENQKSLGSSRSWIQFSFWLVVSLCCIGYLFWRNNNSAT